MSDKPKDEKSAPKTEQATEKKGSDTVHLSAEELRKLSGGIATSTPPPQR
jgi:hypothetical protein